MKSHLSRLFCVTSLVLAVNSTSAQNITEDQLKSNTSPITNSVEKLSLLEPVSFNYNLEKFNKLQLPGGRQYGFLAENIQTAFPDIIKPQSKLVPAGKNAFKTATIQDIDMVSLIPFLVSSIKEQQAEIQKLKEEIRSLKSSSQVVE